MEVFQDFRQPFSIIQHGWMETDAGRAVMKTRTTLNTKTLIKGLHYFQHWSDLILEVLLSCVFIFVMSVIMFVCTWCICLCV